MTTAKSDQGVPRLDMRARDPLTCLIIGIDDVSEGHEKHSCFDGPSNNTELLEHEIDYADKYGIKRPVELVRDGDCVIVVEGRKSTRCMRAANERRIARGDAPRLIPTTIISGNVESPGIRRERITANWLRRKIPMSVKAREAQELLDNNEMTRDEIAALLGVKQQQLDNILGLVSLGAKATKALDSGMLTPTAALPLIGKSVKEQDELLAKAIEATPTGKRPTAEKIRKAAGKAEVRTPKVRLNKASTHFALLAPVLAGHLAGIPDDDPVWADLSIIASELTDMSWGELIAGESELDELPSTADQVALALEPI